MGLVISDLSTTNYVYEDDNGKPGFLRIRTAIVTAFGASALGLNQTAQDDGTMQSQFSGSPRYFVIMCKYVDNGVQKVVYRQVPYNRFPTGFLIGDAASNPLKPPFTLDGLTGWTLGGQFGEKRPRK